MPSASHQYFPATASYWRTTHQFISCRFRCPLSRTLFTHRLTRFQADPGTRNAFVISHYAHVCIARRAWSLELYMLRTCTYVNVISYPGYVVCYVSSLLSGWPVGYPICQIKTKNTNTLEFYINNWSPSLAYQVGDSSSAWLGIGTTRIPKHLRHCHQPLSIVHSRPLSTIRKGRNSVRCVGQAAYKVQGSNCATSSMRYEI